MCNILDANRVRLKINLDVTTDLNWTVIFSRNLTDLYESEEISLRMNR